MDQITGYYDDPEAPELTDAELAACYRERIEGEAAPASAPLAARAAFGDFSYELACDAKWERENLSDFGGRSAV